MDNLRPRIAVLLVAALVILGLASVTVHMFRQQTSGPASTRPLSDEEKAALRARASPPVWTTLLSVGVAFAGLLAVYVFLRWSRVYRSRLLRRPTPPTPVDDVWSMHRLDPGWRERQNTDDEAR